MKLINTTRRSLLLGVALLGTTTFVGFATPASAQSRRDYDRKDDAKDTRKEDRDRDRKDDAKDARKDAKEARRDERRDAQRENRPGYGSGRSNNGSFRPGYQGRDRSDNQNNDGYRPSDRYQGQNRDYRPGNPNGGYRQGQNGGYRQGSNYGGYQNGGYHQGQNGSYQSGGSNYGRSYTGTVTKVRSNQSFDVRISDQTFNVYTNGGLPRGLSNGDTVEVNGVQQGTNDIRNASVSLIRNR